MWKAFDGSKRSKIPLFCSLSVQSVMPSKRPTAVFGLLPWNVTFFGYKNIGMSISETIFFELRDEGGVVTSTLKKSPPSDKKSVFKFYWYIVP